MPGWSISEQRVNSNDCHVHVECRVVSSFRPMACAHHDESVQTTYTSNNHIRIKTRFARTTWEKQHNSRQTFISNVLPSLFGLNQIECATSDKNVVVVLFVPKWSFAWALDGPKEVHKLDNYNVTLFSSLAANRGWSVGHRMTGPLTPGHSTSAVT